MKCLLGILKTVLHCCVVTENRTWLRNVWKWWHELFYLCMKYKPIWATNIQYQLYKKYLRGWYLQHFPLALHRTVTENLGISPKAGEILVIWFGFILTSLEMTLSYSYFMMTLNIHFKSWYWASKVTISIQYSLLTEIVSCVN